MRTSKTLLAIGTRVWISVSMGRGKAKLTRAGTVTGLSAKQTLYEIELDIETFGVKKSMIHRSRIQPMGEAFQVKK